MTAIGLVLHAAAAMAGAIAILADCTDPALATPPAVEPCPTPTRSTPTPGAVLFLPTPEPSALADEAYAVLDVLTTQYSPLEIGSEHEPYNESLRRVTRAVAVGAIIVVDKDDAIVDKDIVVLMTEAFNPFDISPDPRIITVVSVGRDKGKALLELIEQRDVTASIKVDVMKQPLWNMMAYKGGAEETDRRVILGAHYDTSKDSQSANRT